MSRPARRAARPGRAAFHPLSKSGRGCCGQCRAALTVRQPDPLRRHERSTVGSVIKKRRKRMAKKKHRKLLKKTRIQRRRAGK
ncbi:protein of unknown function [Propionibacterium cyclohexanicum]|uniref:Ribosomal protein mS38 C-terminal domain-containing protein n=1 Tax=Propionibacterium cyclohexanicum TaxID=64702 RepID=A0A1H9RTR9_9ACTN|nr:protein of unknown function [Propionibacterium cyclohexanicum]